MGGATAGDREVMELVTGGNDGGRGLVTSVAAAMAAAGTAAEVLVPVTGEGRANLRVLPRTAKRLEREG
jgi:hypothetical protein